MKLGTIIICLALAASVASAQNGQTILIQTTPSGATVYLKGDFEYIAKTPANLPSNLTGLYKAKITRPGYESWKGDLTFIPGNANNFNIELKRKTRLKAGFRSLLIPGWGQVYSGNTTRGGIITLSAAVAAGGLYFLDKEYQDKRSDYDIASQAYYNSSSSIDEKNRLKAIMNKQQRRAYNAETDRRNAFYLLAGIWSYNLLDAVVFFPNGDSYFPVVSAIDGGASLTYSFGF
jgi:hypothetical protein